MKKIKLLMPILGATTLVGLITPVIASCKYDATLFEVVVLGDKEISLSNHIVEKDQKFEADVSWITTRKVVDKDNIKIYLGQDQEQELESGFEYTPGAMCSASGHLVINAGLINKKVTIVMQLIDDVNQKAKIVANNVNPSSSASGWEATIPEGQDIAWVGEDAIIEIYWHDDTVTNEDVRYYSELTTVELADGTVIHQASKNNPKGYCFLDYYENGMRIKIPGENITSNQQINISLQLNQSTDRYYGYNVNQYHGHFIQYQGVWFDTLNSIRLPAVSSGQYLEFSIDLNKWGNGSREGQSFDGDIYFMIAENATDTGGNIVDLNSSYVGNIWYGDVQLNAAVSTTGYITILEPNSGWGNIGNLSRITGYYHFIEDHNAIEIFVGQESNPQ